MWVRLGVEHEASNTSREHKEHSSNDNKHDSPGREQRDNVDGSVLSSVGEVVVSGRHVVEVTSDVHSDQTTIEILRGSIELHAVLDILLSSVLVVVVLLEELFQGQAVSLSEHGHPLSELNRLEERLVGSNPGIRGWEGVGQVFNLHHVVSISPVSSFSSVSSRVGVATSPLEVDVVTSSGVEDFRVEVVLSGWVSLHNVSSLSTDVEVENASIAGDTLARSDVEDVGSVLEGSSELGGIKSQFVRELVLVGQLIVEHRGVLSVGSPINERGIRSVAQVVGGNVVSNSEHTVAVITLDALFFLSSWESPVVVGVESFRSVSKVVVSGPWGLDTVWLGNAPGSLFDPVETLGLAFSFIVGLGLDTVLIGTVPSALDILGFALVEIAVGHVLSHDGNIPPWRGNPVWVIVSLFGAFETISVSIVVLAGKARSSSASSQTSFFFSVSNVETHVSLSGGASLVPGKRLVHAKGKFSIFIGLGGTSFSGRDGVGGGSITDSLKRRSSLGSASVLQNNVAIQLGVETTTVLVGPLNVEERAFIVAQ